MLHILFLILKIIGIILLTILGILILLLLIVFFVPLRYQVTAEFAGDLKKSKLEVKFSWFLHVLAGKVTYMEEKLDHKVRILWKTISEDSVKESKSSKKEEKNIEPDEIDDKVSKKAETEKTVEKTSDDKPKEESKEKPSESKIDKLKCTIQKVCDTIKMVLEFLKAEAHVGAFGKIKKEIIRLLISLKPKKMHGKIRFGMDDPYKTGQILAVLSALYPIYAENVEIYPEFEEKVLEGNIYIKGHIRGIHAVVMAFRIILDKNVRTTIKDVKSLLESN